MIENTPTPEQSCPLYYPDDIVTITINNDVGGTPYEVVFTAQVIGPDYAYGNRANGFIVTLLNNLTLVSSTPAIPVGETLIDYIFNNFDSPVGGSDSVIVTTAQHQQYKNGPIITRTYDTSSPVGLKLNIHRPSVGQDYVKSVPGESEDLIVLTCDYETGGTYPYPLNNDA